MTNKYCSDCLYGHGAEYTDCPMLTDILALFPPVYPMPRVMVPEDFGCNRWEAIPQDMKANV